LIQTFESGGIKYYLREEINAKEKIAELILQIGNPVF